MHRESHRLVVPAALARAFESYLCKELKKTLLYSLINFYFVGNKISLEQKETG